MRLRPAIPRQAVRLALCLMSAGCANRTLPSIAIAPSDERAILTLVRSALDLDANGLLLDSLYTVSATIVANGAERTAAPLFAGVGTGGTVRVSSLTGNATPPSAWVYAAYRWTSADGSVTESGMATFILTLVDGRWRIRHAHSSLVLPWQRSSGAD